MIKPKIDTLGHSVHFPFGCDPAEVFQFHRTGGAGLPGVADPGLRRLMAALLEDALDNYQKYFSKPSRKIEAQFREVEEWIVSENDDGLFSFGNVCESLGIDPDWLRKRLLLWKGRRQNGTEGVRFLIKVSFAKKEKAPASTHKNESPA